jgi:hypothetical protein
LRGFARGACLAPALLRRTFFGIVTPSSSDTPRRREAMRLAGFGFFFMACRGARGMP